MDEMFRLENFVSTLQNVKSNLFSLRWEELSKLSIRILAVNETHSIMTHISLCNLSEIIPESTWSAQSWQAQRDVKSLAAPPQVLYWHSLKSIILLTSPSLPQPVHSDRESSIQTHSENLTDSCIIPWIKWKSGAALHTDMDLCDLCAPFSYFEKNTSTFLSDHLLTWKLDRFDSTKELTFNDSLTFNSWFFHRNFKFFEYFDKI